ncbi:MAG: hypothetical protein WC810_03050 [Janthinobacterium sp.]|jgi:hypothetical protein
MKDPIEKFENPRIFEYQAWQNIIKSPEWKYFLNVLNEHKIHLDKQTCVYVCAGKFNEAMMLQSKAEDIMKITSLVEERISDLERSNNDG